MNYYRVAAVTVGVVTFWSVIGYTTDSMLEISLLNAVGLWGYLFYKEMTEEPQ